jgi:hypothetical protein
MVSLSLGYSLKRQHAGLQHRAAAAAKDERSFFTLPEGNILPSVQDIKDMVLSSFVKRYDHVQN